MSSNNPDPEYTQQQINMFHLLAECDMSIQKIGKKIVMIIGLTRAGKSAIYNYIFKNKLIGVRGTDGDVGYDVQVANADIALSKAGNQSITTLPNIGQLQNYCIGDFAGFMDTRVSAKVVAVSYIIKAAFEKIEEVQFALVVGRESFSVKQALYDTIRGFINMWNFNKLSPEVKRQLLNSVTLCISRVRLDEEDQEYFQDKFKSQIKQFKNPNYQKPPQANQILQVLEHFAQNPQQIFLFEKAIRNKQPSECRIQQDHFKIRPFFQLKTLNATFFKDNKRKFTIYRAPFEEDYNRIIDVTQKNKLTSEITARLQSYGQSAMILQDFFKKAIVPANLLDENLKFTELFEKIEKFNKKYNVYPKEMDIYKITKLKNTFNPNQSNRKLPSGIRMAKNAFKLYKYLSEFPTYQDQEDLTRLQEFMNEFEEHERKILTLFRDSFCSSYEQQNLIQIFLFIAARGCRQFSVIYQVTPWAKNDMCVRLKDNFQSLINSNPIESVHESFILEIYNNIDMIIDKINTDKKQDADLYIKYLQEIGDEYPSIKQRLNVKFDQLIEQFLKIDPKREPEDQLVSLTKTLKQHYKKVEREIDRIADQQNQQQQQYPQSLNLTCYNLLFKIADRLLNLERPDSLKDDKFASNEYNPDDQEPEGQGKKDPKKKTVKQTSTISQATNAQNIFNYIGCVKSVCKTYDVIIKNVPKDDFQQRYEWYTGYAKYCSKHGRIEQAIDLYQTASSICIEGDLQKEYSLVNKQLINVYTLKDQLMKAYFNGLKQKRIIDPTDDSYLQEIMRDLEDYYIRPYLEYKEEQRNKANAKH